MRLYHTLAIVNNGTMNLGMQIALHNHDFRSCGYIPNVELMDGSSIFNILRNLHTIFHNGCTNLHTHQWSTGDPFSPHRQQHFLSLVFLIIVILRDIKWYILWFWFAFPWWLLTSNTFWCTWWSCACLWKNIYSDPLKSGNMKVHGKSPQLLFNVPVNLKLL